VKRYYWFRLRCWFQVQGKNVSGRAGEFVRRPAANGSSQDAAQTGLRVMQSLVRPETFQGLGFTSVDQAKNAQLGDPLKIFIVPLDELTAYKGDANAAGLLHDAHKLIYPVTVDQQVVSSLSATQRDDGWRATEFGNSALTRALVAHRASKDDFVVWGTGAEDILYSARRRRRAGADYHHGRSQVRIQSG